MLSPSYPSARRGNVYILSHPAMPNLVKIGITSKHPIARATELAGSTGVPGAFIVEYWLGFEDAFEVESLVHEYFDGFRMDPAREFFYVDVGEVVRYIRHLKGTYVSFGNEGGEWTESTPKEVLTPWAELFASFPDDGLDRELTPEEQARCRALSLKQGNGGRAL